MLRLRPLRKLTDPVRSVGGTRRWKSVETPAQLVSLVQTHRYGQCSLRQRTRRCGYARNTNAVANAWLGTDRDLEMSDGEPMNTRIEDEPDDREEDKELPAERLDDDYDIATARTQIHRAQPGGPGTVTPDPGNDRDEDVATPDSAETAVPGEADAAESSHGSFNTDEWSTDLGRVIKRSTGGRLVFEDGQLRHMAGDLLGHSFGSWIPEAAQLRLHQQRGDVAYVPDFTVEHWADDLNQAILRETKGSARLDRVDLRVAANLLLHGQEDEWIPQASRLRQEYESAAGTATDSTGS